MRSDRPSDTAELVCSWRALEHLLPPDERILDDPYARAFVGKGRGAVLDAIERLPARARSLLARRADRALQGTMSFVCARHRAIDELIAATPGATQVVLLGAGYDSRAVRLVRALEGKTLFEVDHPATAARKASLAPAAYGGAPRARTVPVTIDFARESIEEKLRAAGLGTGALTVWVWEGVSMYLEESAVRGTLDLVRGLSAPGSLLAFDVWCPPAEGLARLTRRELPSLAFRLIYSEPLVWGPTPAELEGVLREHGLALIDDADAATLVARYGARRRPVLEWSSMRFAVAEVDRPV
jgi:methyltransferase (TIGR00027 family)